MAKAHSLKAEGKPNLFSFDIDTEYKNIDKWVFDNKRYAKRDLEKEAEMLRQITKDFIEIIETKSINDKQLQSLLTATNKGARGVWETATSKLELLSYHFEIVKQFIKNSISDGKNNNIERLLIVVSDAFSTQEQIEIFKKTIENKSKKIRFKTANVALNLRNRELITFLKLSEQNETDNKVRESIRFAIENMHQPKGELIF